MKITDIISGEKPSLSFEVFPPKSGANFETVEEAALKIAALKPSYMSVTYGAGGGTSRYTADIAGDILKRGVTPRTSPVYLRPERRLKISFQF